PFLFLALFSPWRTSAALPGRIAAASSSPPLPSFLSFPVQTLTIPRLSNSRCCRGDGRCQALRNSGGPVLSP
ncbi:Os08g0300901, partial [Oryza sativa Japonica Group]